ncbi:MAG: ribosomal protein S18-alanine N-acetyltransferase [Gemmatimonadota bacterium]|nr:MAG: ribosomal protein S18-alanine N-acetyltransferase [Gemmatimonadota bacterium]
MSTAEALLTPDIRRMEESDLDVVMEVERESFSTPWSRGTFRGLMRRSDASLWVAEVSHCVVGYAVVWYLFQQAELGNLAVAPGWRRRGLGKRLLDWALEKARERGTERIFLEVRISNRAAQRLYERYGFVQVGLRRRYYREPVEDARVMSLDLGQLFRGASQGGAG